MKDLLPWLLLAAVTLGWYIDRTSPPPPTVADVGVEAVAPRHPGVAPRETYGVKPGIVLSVKADVEHYLRTLLHPPTPLRNQTP